MNILVLGATGMLGSAVFSTLSAEPSLEVFGTLRSFNSSNSFPKSMRERLLNNIDVLDHDSLVSAMERVRPNVVINCIGLIKQVAASNDPLLALPINAMLPHRLAKLCGLTGARLIHISTDCVFSGAGSMYKEADVSDANDLYGKSKYLGELHDLPHAITLRTSIIGHGIGGNDSLIDWFLEQRGPVKGFRKAIFSGLPTVELARIMRDYIIPSTKLCGLYHVSAEPISKYQLLSLVAKEYGKCIEIVPDDNLVIDRSLDSLQFRQATGYMPSSWPTLITSMYSTRSAVSLY